jgi:hypothetical protein
MNQILYNWTFDDTKNRSALWYIIALSIVIWFTIWWFFTKQYWMSFLMLLVAWVFFFVENNADDTIHVSITELWIKVWDIFYDYTVLDGYSFIYSWEEAILLRLSTNKSWIKRLDLKINSEIAVQLKEILPNYIEAKDNQELSMTEKIINLLQL